ncbi:MAG: cytochrome c551 [Cyclobacteriaceae bacterium]|jgi:cytochrome c551
MNQLSKLIPVLIISVLASCGTKTGNESPKESTQLDSREEIRLKQYRVKGAEIYAQLCANCHQQDGSGLASLYPPLAGSDYLLSDLERAACMIKKGGFDPITVNGKTYNQMMPANEQLTPLEIAEVLTFISNAWGNEKGLSGVKDVEKWLMKCE